MNYFHDKLVLLTRQLDLNFNDKQLHFLVIGFLGIVLFILVNRLFKYLVRYSLTVISFIYTFTVLVVLVFAIEIGQKITGRGNMEFQDIVEGLWGFLIAFVLYQGIVIIARWLKRAIKYTLLGIQ
ncbi:MAG: membrane protein [Peptococcaceae bacterium BRH_c23]|nr:MAG: membrane protein [Peptococcaceae bacterium BRH_c23]KJS90439.1 MAG: membrane protein [Desulfosporosinus sp. BICA1-9]